METNNKNLSNEKKKDNKFIGFFKSRKTRHGTLAIMLSVIFIAIIVGLNIVLTILSNNFTFLNLDLTSNSVYQLQDQTVKQLKNVKDDVNIYILADEKAFESYGDYYVQANKLIKQFPKENSKIHLKYKNLTKEPNFTLSYPDINWSNSATLILVESGKEYIGVTNEDMFDYETDYSSYSYTVSGQHVEQAVVTAILNVTSKDKVTVSVLEGQDEKDCSAFTTLLQNSAYNVKKLNLLTSDFDKETEFLIIYAPAKDIDDDILEKIETWLENGGKYGHNLIYFPMDSKEETYDNLNSLVEDYGMQLQKGYVFETDTSKITGNYGATAPLMDYNKDDDIFIKNLKSKTPVFMPYTTPVKITDKTTARYLLTSSDKAVLYPFDADENWDYKKASKSALYGACVGTKTKDDSSSNLFVIGSYDALSSSPLSSSSVNNAEFFTNIFNSLTDKKDTGITIQGKTLDNQSLGINQSQLIIINIIVRYIIPFGVLILGIVLWIFRRHK